MSCITLFFFFLYFFPVGSAVNSVEPDKSLETIWNLKHCFAKIKSCKFFFKKTPSVPLSLPFFQSPTGPFTILQPHHQEISELYWVPERRATDFEAPKLRKGRSGVTASGRCLPCCSFRLICLFCLASNAGEASPLGWLAISWDTTWTLPFPELILHPRGNLPRISRISQQGATALGVKYSTWSKQTHTAVKLATNLIVYDHIIKFGKVWKPYWLLTRK